MLTDAEATRVEEQLARLPKELRNCGYDMVRYPTLGIQRGIAAMWSRRDEFDDYITAVLAGMAIYKPSREKLEVAMTREFQKRELGYGYYDEVVIGSGIHAAIYAMSRVRLGYPAPLIIDFNEKGGTFAVPQGDAFYLNSRNRPGDAISVPGQRGPLNLLPNGIIQPSDIGGGEYQTNDDLAHVVRMNLIMSGATHMTQRIDTIRKERGRYYLFDEFGDVLCEAKRVVIATGLGQPKFTGNNSSSFNVLQFMRRMASTEFPLRGLRRVAVIGAKDSGNIAVEALLGQGPCNNSVSALDFVERIDWFGQECLTATQFSEARSRYEGISRYMPNNDGRYSRIRAFPQKVTLPDLALEYDAVVDCTGFSNKFVRSLCITLQQPLLPVTRTLFTEETVAMRIGSEDIYVIGPAANIPTTAEEISNAPALRRIGENSAAIFRYAQRTADFAAREEILSYQ